MKEKPFSLTQWTFPPAASTIGEAMRMELLYETKPEPWKNPEIYLSLLIVILNEWSIELVHSQQTIILEAKFEGPNAK